MANRRIPNEVIEAVLKQSDIVEIVGKYVHLTKQGHYMKGLCPFHSEKTPSFTVTPEKQIYYCYGCHAGGNAIHFLMEIEGYSYGEAVRELAEEAGVPVSWDPAEEEETEEQRELALMYSAYELATKWYRYILRNTEQGRAAMDYVRGRGMNDKLLDTFQIGYAPQMWDKLVQFLEKRQFPLPLMEKAGLITSRAEGGGYIDKFRDRVMFPICDHRGRVIAFGGRIMGDGQPKYMNSPETRLFNKSRHLFNLHQARPFIRKQQSVVLLEGYMDVIKAWEAGVQNGVATMGTALTPEHVQQLRRLTGETVVCYDGDAAGQAAAYKSIGLLEKEGLHVKVAWLPNGLDPDEYVAARGADSFRDEIIGAALPSVQFKLLYIRKNFNLQDVDGKLRYLDTALKIVAELPLPLEREHYVKELANEFQYSPQSMVQQMHRFREEMLKKRGAGDNPDQTWNNVINNGSRREAPPASRPAHYNWEIKLLAAMFHSREVADLVQAQLDDRFINEEHAALAAYLYAYYADGNEPDVSRYIATLHDERLERLASYISMQDPHHAMATAEHYIHAIKLYPQLKELEERKQCAERSGDPIQAATIIKEIIALESQLKSL